MSDTNITLERVEELREWLNSIHKEADRCGWVKDVTCCADLLATLDEKATQLKAGGGQPRYASGPPLTSKEPGCNSLRGVENSTESPGPSDITTEKMLDLLESMHNHQESPLTPKGEADFRAVVARLTDYSLLKEQRDDAVAENKALSEHIELLERVDRENLEKAEADYNEAMNGWREDILRLGKAEVDMGRLRAELADLKKKYEGAKALLFGEQNELAAARPLLKEIEEAVEDELDLTLQSMRVWEAALAYRRAKSPEANIGNAEEATDEAK